MKIHKVAILIPPIASRNEISGGMNVIFQHAILLAQKGISITFVSSKKANCDALSWHPIYQFLKHPKICWCDFSDVLGEHFDVAIASWWKTYFSLWRINAERFVYFVQSIESRFFNENDQGLAALVEGTYEQPVGFITEAQWIKEYLQKMHDFAAELVLNGIDKNIFSLEGKAILPREPNKLRVLIEGPIEPFFKNVLNTIKICRKSKADEIWLLTSSPIKKINGVDKVFSQIALNETPEVYRSCDVLVKLSYVEGMFGPPLEMFHCGGTAIVYNVTGHDEYIKHGVNGLIAEMDNENAVIGYLDDLKKFPELLQKLKKGALETAKAWVDWNTSGQMFFEALPIVATQSSITREQLAKYSRRLSSVFSSGLTKDKSNKLLLRYINKLFIKSPVMRIYIKKLWKHLPYKVQVLCYRILNRF